MSTLALAITGWEVEPWLERFRHLMPERPVLALDAVEDPASVHFAATWRHASGSLARLPHLRAVFSLGAGVDHLLADPDLPDVPLARVVDPDLTTRMSEYVVLHCLAQLRGYPRYAAQQRGRLWLDDRHQPAAREVRVGVMGYGELGRDAALKLATIGFDVAAWSRTPQEPGDPRVRVHAGEGERAAFLVRTDILICLLPLTPDTRGMLGAALFAGLARDGRLGGPVVINAGRGGLQVEADILAALDAGVLGAAVLDVFETEPLPPDSPLWTHPAVTVTPHNAAMSAPDAVCTQIAQQIRHLEGGLALRHTVDRRLGY